MIKMTTIDVGFVVGVRWRFDHTHEWSGWTFRQASGSTGLTMLYRSEKSANKNNSFGVVREKRFGYFELDNYTEGLRSDPNYGWTTNWRKEEADFETRLFPANLSYEVENG